MKKYLEILVDEEGNFLFSTDEQPLKGIDNHVKEKDLNLLKLTEALVKECWKNQNQVFNQLIRTLSMAEALSCAQPYSMVEEYWSTMMFSTIPFYEKKVAKMKIPYGYKDREVIRPKVFSPGMSIFPLGMNGKMN